jgi:hypothetical protein
MRLTVVNYRDGTRPLDRDRGLIERSSQTALEGWTTAREGGGRDDLRGQATSGQPQHGRSCQQVQIM